MCIMKFHLQWTSYKMFMNSKHIITKKTLKWVINKTFVTLNLMIPSSQKKHDKFAIDGEFHSSVTNNVLKTWKPNDM
jgi:hypothetical protein